jgi:hypothetical protein
VVGKGGGNEICGGGWQIYFITTDLGTNGDNNSKETKALATRTMSSGRDEAMKALALRQPKN